jgi:ABC-type sugar transport system ATPase subunit
MGGGGVAEPILRMENISKSFGPVRALSSVSIELYPGEVLALMGENGAGKSTLMNVLSGALRHYEGRMIINGSQRTFASPLAAREAGIAKIHQELQLVKEMSVAENMFLGREVVNRAGFMQKRRMEQMAKKYLDMLELDISPAKPIRQLRVGEQQMVEIAKALSLNARILIMDEPTSAISEQEAEKLFSVIRRLAREGVGIIYITHRMQEVFMIADRLTVLRDGRLIGTVSARESSRDQIISMMVGREIKDMYPKTPVPPGAEVLRVENLCLNGRGFRRSLRNVSFTLQKGEVLGIAGLLGSGRSELLESLFGLHPHDVSGDIYIEGRKVSIRKPRDAIVQGISFATEDRKGKGLVLPRSIGENLSLPMLELFSRFGFMNAAVEHKNWLTQMKGMRIKAPSFAAACETLSGGNQQKVVLGRWLITRPKVLLLDEPTRGIDVGAKAEIYQLISDLAGQGMGIIVISSELPEVIGISDRILTFCEGRTTGVFNREDATQEKLLDAATMREENAV